MAAYTYAPAPVLDEVTGDFAIGVSGVLKDEAGGTTVQAYDLNDSPIASIVVGPKGAHGAFKADISHGVLDFGSVLLPTSSLEQQAAGLIAVETANDAAASAAVAADEAETAAAAAAALAAAVEDNPSVADVNTLIAVALQAALETNQTPMFLRYNFATNSWAGKVRQNTTRPVIFVHPQAARPAVNGTTAGGTLAAVPGLDYFFEAAT